MDVIKTKLDSVVIIEPKIFDDARGYFFESFSQREFEEKVRKINFVQDNESMSSYGVMRGLHFQRPPFTQSKLVRCVNVRKVRRHSLYRNRWSALYKGRRPFRQCDDTCLCETGGEDFR